jgi:hypothetical protein
MKALRIHCLQQNKMGLYENKAPFNPISYEKLEEQLQFVYQG